ncbi:uncharacterized protein [Euwallacea similis]|uniref:uncharacterized protein n=1 Tax=Euwallacea similis TaxID=1736056 RepID=UPI00344D25E8
MDTSLYCQICGETFSFNPECLQTLGEHLLLKHPNVEVIHFFNNNLCHCHSSSSGNNLSTGPRTSMPCKFQSLHKPKDRLTSKCFFKTTVETWKPGPLKVVCPYCSALDRPCIHRQRNKVAYSPIGALCLLVCWPVCFMPFLMPESSQIQLFCKKCGAFLGEYDRKTGRMKCPPCPSKEEYNTGNMPPVF